MGDVLKELIIHLIYQARHVLVLPFRIRKSEGRVIDVGMVGSFVGLKNQRCNVTPTAFIRLDHILTLVEEDPYSLPIHCKTPTCGPPTGELYNFPIHDSLHVFNLRIQGHQIFIFVCLLISLFRFQNIMEKHSGDSIKLQCTAPWNMDIVSNLQYKTMFTNQTKYFDLEMS